MPPDPDNRAPAKPVRQPGDLPQPPKSEHRVSFGHRLRNYFIAGLLVAGPISITIYIAALIVGFVDVTVTRFIPPRYNPQTYLPFAVPGLGVVIAIVFLTLIGALAAGFVGRLWVRLSEQVLSRMPVVRGIYSALKQIFETVFAQQSNAFREAVLVEFPRPSAWAIGFITGVTEGEVQEVTKETVVNVFVPTTPNPTSGFMIFVPRRQLVPLAMATEDALKMVISGGIVTPPDRRTPEQRRRTQAFVADRRLGETIDPGP